MDMSLPSRERGLKFKVIEFAILFYSVAPFAGAWIEIQVLLPVLCTLRVAPFAGAWIEIKTIGAAKPKKERRSLRGSVD